MVIIRRFIAELLYAVGLPISFFRGVMWTLWYIMLCVVTGNRIMVGLRRFWTGFVHGTSMSIDQVEHWVTIGEWVKIEKFK